jgi:two-component system nitrogen regulation response regulator NtrX
MTSILVVDDVQAMAEQYAYDLARLGGYETTVASGGEEALGLAHRIPFDCIILDLEMPGTDGFQVLRHLRDRNIQTPVIVYTGTGDYERCVRAVQLGASGFIDKGESMHRVFHEVESVLERERLRGRVASLSAQLDREKLLVGASPAMGELRKVISRVAGIPSPVLILGESGTGKELVAREIHGFSSGEAPFIALNCAALPENLIESELFGHERGAFTGASTTRRGAFEAAERGTLMLDEVGELPLPTQAKLLRVLEQREVTRVGSNRTIQVGARVIAATNRDLEADVRDGRFREDLLYRLNVHVVRTPPLRDRLSDIPQLVRHFVSTICDRFGIRQKSVDAGVMDLLMQHEWRRNNVRELRNVVERMIVAAEGDRVTTENVPGEIAGQNVASPAGTPVTFAERKAEAERRIIFTALERNAWHISNTAAELGLADHSSLLKIMRRHGITRD